MKVNLTTLGCPKNLVDSELLLGGLNGEGIEFVDDPREAETIILNTCGFIQGAKEESIDAILQAVEMKKQGRCTKLFVTGCLSQRYPHELAREVPEVDGFYGNRDMNQILKELTTELNLKREILGERLISTPRHYAYLKISEGCENPCTFCAIPAIRGRFRSRPLEALVEEAHMLAERGVRELLLVAQDTTIYGQDLYGKRRLAPLLDKLCDIKVFKWIRLLYTYPAHFSEDIIEIIIDKHQVIKYIDMPIQHVSDRLLRRMARKVKRKDIESIIHKLRAGHPQLAIRTTLISGFPGETEADHRELCDFVEDIRFERLGLFTYSREQGTPASHFPDQVSDHIMQERWAELNDLQTQVSFELNQGLVGKTLEVVIDAYQSDLGVFVGRTGSDCPEIDNSVSIEEQELIIGRFYSTKIMTCGDHELQGRITV
ncbi:MAG: 30S ribosomal protein S12 methylthiotransferase RimO [bacterium]